MKTDIKGRVIVVPFLQLMVMFTTCNNHDDCHCITTKMLQSTILVVYSPLHKWINGVLLKNNFSLPKGMDHTQL